MTGSSVFRFPAPGKRLEGKVALITGGASGIGECTARLFSLHGAKVVIADIQDDCGKAIADDLGGNGFAIFVHCDVTSEDDLRNAVDTAVSAYGKLDIMLNNAGIVHPPALLVDTNKSQIERVIAVNLTGAILGTKQAARVMVPARKGCIISTSSASSVMGGSLSCAYTCSKHGVVGLTKEAALELGRHGVRVNCVSPFLVGTPLLTVVGVGVEDAERTTAEKASLKGTVLKAEDVAQAVLYLASDEAKYVSGHNLVVDGGYTVANSPFAASAI